MGLIDLLQTSNGEAPQLNQPSLFKYELNASSSNANGAEASLFEKLKLRVQARLLEKIDVTKLEEAGYAALLGEITSVIDELIQQDKLLLTDIDRARLLEPTTSDMLGLGPLEPLLQDNDISDILVNGAHEVWVERKGKLYRTSVKFHNDQHLLSIINRIVARVGRRIDEASPMVDARLPDGSRVNAIIPPLAIDGPGLSIRRFGGHAFRVEDLVKNNTLRLRWLNIYGSRC
jgi:pilus assembly protein CpaF